MRRLWKRLRAWMRGDDDGAATAEFAVVLPVVVVTAALLLYLARASVTQISCQDAAADVARATLVSDVGVAAPAGVQVAVADGGDRITVTTTCRVLADPLGVLPATVHGRAVVVKQDMS